MGLREWIAGLRRREDAAAVDRADEVRNETDAEREVTSGDIEGMATGAEAREHGGPMPADEPEPPR
jgi:hypothetical protein